MVRCARSRAASPTAALFGTGYGLALGPVFGLASGASHGITLAWEYSRASRGAPDPGFFVDSAMSAIRGIGFAVGMSYLHGVRFGVTFGVLSTLGQMLAYRVGVRPSAHYEPGTRFRFSRFQVLAAANRGVGYIVTGYLASLVAKDAAHALAVGLRSGLAIGIVTAISGGVHAGHRMTADHVPERRMGVFGIGLILVGFTMQSVQYWIALLDIPLR